MNAADAGMNTAYTANTTNAVINATNISHGINQAMVTATKTATAAVTTMNNDVGESLSSIALIEAVPIGHNNTANTQSGLDTAIKYIKMWFQHRGLHERFNTLPDNFSWLARTV